MTRPDDCLFCALDEQNRELNQKLDRWVEAARGGASPADSEDDD